MNINDLNRIFESIDRLDESGLRKIVNSGINLNVIHELRDQTPLICAIDNNWLKGVKILIEAGVNVNKNACAESNPLLCAVSVNNIEMVEILLQNGAGTNNAYIGTPLHTSIGKGNIQITKILIKAGANVNVTDEEGITTLMLAVLCNNLDLVKILIEAGADPNIVLWKYNKTALVMAAEDGNLDIFEYLLPLTTDEKQREYAFEMLPEGMLYRERCNDVITQSLVHYARYNDVIGMEELISHGIDINKFNEKGENALHIASSCGNLDVVNLLIKAGADLDILSVSKHSAVEIATRNNQANIVTRLIEARANLAVEDGTLLMIATARNCIEVAKVLINFGIDVNAKDSYGDTALEQARKSRNVKMIEFLKEAGAVGRYDIEPVPEGEIPF